MHRGRACVARSRLLTAVGDDPGPAGRMFLAYKRLSARKPVYSDEAGHRFGFEAGQSFPFHSGRRSDLKAAISRTDPGSV